MSDRSRAIASLSLSVVAAAALAACSAGAIAPGSPGSAAPIGPAGTARAATSALAAGGSPPRAGSAMTGFASAPNPENAPAAIIPITYPIGLAVDAKNELYIGNHYNGKSQILVFSSAGVELPSRTLTKDIVNPAGLAFDAAGNFYVADATNNDWQEYTPAGKFIRKVATDPNYAPSGIQIEPKSQNIWVALRNNNNITIGEIQVFSQAGNLVCSTTTNLVYPLGIVFSPTTGVAWVGNAETPAGNSLATFNSDCSVHAPPVAVDITPGYLAFDKHNEIWASAPLGASVNHFMLSGKAVGTLTQDVDNPYGVAIDSKGNIYEANVSTSTVGKFNAKGELLKLLM